MATQIKKDNGSEYYIARDSNDAWRVIHTLIDGELVYNQERSNRGTGDVWSRPGDSRINVVDLGTRFEVNKADGTSVNIWFDHSTPGRITILQKARDAACQELFLASANYLMTKPKAGMEDEHAAALKEVETLEAWLKELEAD